MKKQFTKLTAKLFFIAVAVLLLNATKAFGNTDIYPSSFNGAITGGAAYCQNSVASAMSVNWINSECSSGAFFFNYDALTVDWYMSTSLTNSGGALVQSTGANTSSSSDSYTPATTTPGKFYYYVVVNYSGFYCSGGSITTATNQMDSIIVMGATVSYPGSPFCQGSAAVQSPALVGYTDGTYVFTGGTYSSAPAGLTVDPSTGGITPSLSSVGTYTVYYTIPANDGCNLQVDSTTVTVDAPNDVSNFSMTADSVCQGFASSVVINSTTLASGPYTLYYELNGANSAAGNSSSITMSGNTGTFSTTVLNNAGYTDIIIDSITNGGCASILSGISQVINVYAPPSVTASQTASNLCAGGKQAAATANATGGQTPYTYLWNDPSSQTTQTATGLMAGSYTILVTDNYGCAAIQAVVTITNPAALTASASATANVICAGDSNGIASVIAGGGTPLYTYLWSDAETTTSITGLKPGTYSVTVTDNNGCSATSSATITQTDHLALANNVSFSYVTSTVQSWTVPAGVTQITLTTTGGSGGNSNNSLDLPAFGGNGATVTGILNVTPGQVLHMIVGGTGSPVINGGFGGSGGGGTYAWDSASNTILQVGGGGGGCSAIAGNIANNPDNGGDGQSNISTLNNPTTDALALCAAGGTAGNGGSVIPNSSNDYISGAGAGWLSDGATGISGNGGTTTGGSDPANGGAGGSGGFTYTAPGGFGGGGGGNAAGGGGGGYNGGGGGSDLAGGGGGGGSYCSGFVISASATNVGNGSITIGYPSTPVVKNIDCTPGTISLPAASGGVAPYTYSWSPGGGTSNVDSVTLAGTYTLTVSDANGCSIIDSAVVTGTYTALLANISTKNELCNGDNSGSVISSPTGGTSPYTYLWSDANTTTTASVNNLSAGTYSLILTDNTGCSLTTTATITQPTPVVALAVTNTNVTCASDNNGSTSVTPSGGTSPYQYLWSDSQTNSSASALTAGTYTVTVTDDNGCTGTSSTTVTQSDFIAFATSSTFSFVSSADQSWVVPAGVTQVTITTTGGSGGNSNVSGHPNATGGHGAMITAVSNVTPGNTLKILVGGNGYTTTNGEYGGSGGGATYVWDSASNTLLQVAGGGGGCTAIAFNTFGNTDNGGDGQSNIGILNNPTTDILAICAAGGSGGNGGNVIPNSSMDFISGGGAGWLSDGVTGVSGSGGTTTGGSDPANGGAGGSGGNMYIAPGGFGGGGGGNVAGGGGGGYNGGGGGSDLEGGGGGGGSFCSGTVTGTSATNIGNGVAIISYPATPIVTNVTCTAGGTITLPAASGGVSPYTYNWSPSGGTDVVATGLSAGSYTLTATDANGCSITVSGTVGATTPPSVSASVTSNVSCNGGSDGSAIANPSGGTTPYTYAWSDANTTSTINISSLSFGSYTVTVTDSNGCNATASVTISQPAAFLYIIAGTGNNVTCNGGNNGSVTVNSVGGRTPYTYSWSNGATTQIASSLSAGSYTVLVSDSCGASHTATANVSQPNAMRDSVVTQVNIICGGGNGGSITIGAKGGSYPYRYLWSNGGTSATITGLTAGTYSVVVTDLHGCTNTVGGITITQPTPISETLASSTYPLCNGGRGSASVNVSGGSSPYVYIWSPSVSSTASASNLAAGSYTVSIKDAHRCTASLVVVITQPLAIRDTIVRSLTQNVSCFGNGTGNGSATVGVKYGTSPYTYTWNPNVSSTATASGLGAGVYSVTVTDNNGCTSSVAMVTITQPLAPLTDSVSLLSGVGCFGGSGGEISVGTRGGTNPYTYSWSNGKSTYSVSNLSAGTYSVTVTDAHGCTSIITGIVVTQPSAALTSTIPTPVCAGNRTGTITISASGGTSAYRFVWSNGRTTTTMTVPDGTYTVKVSDAHGCTSTNSVILACPGSLKEDVESPAPPTCCATMENINLYPNPNNGQFTLTGLEQGMTVEMYDYTGRKVSTISASEISLQLNISSEPNGIYLIRILDKDGNLVSQKKVVKTN